MKRNGFTLIELLGVIVVLGILVLIIYPIVGSILTKSKERTLINTGQGIIKKFKQLYVPYVGKDVQYSFDTKKMTVAGSEVNVNFSVSGELPEGGYVLANEKGEISLYVYKEGYCMYKAVTDRDVLIKKIGDDISLCGA